MYPEVSSAKFAEITPINRECVAKCHDIRLSRQMDDKFGTAVIQLRYCNIGFQSYFVIYFH